MKVIKTTAVFCFFFLVGLACQYLLSPGDMDLYKFNSIQWALQIIWWIGVLCFSIWITSDSE